MRRLLMIVLLGTSCLVVAPAEVAGAADAPDTKITGGPRGLTNDPTPTFRFRVRAGALGLGPAAGFKCQVDKKPRRTCTSPITWSRLKDGPHVFKVFAIDGAGNRDPSPARRKFIVDGTPPVVSIISGPAAGSTVASDDATFKFKSSEPKSTFKCKLDSQKTYLPCVLDRKYTNLDEGPHIFKVFAIDRAGNKDETPAMVTWHVDTMGPAVLITSGPDNGSATSNNDPEFTFSADPPAGVTFECSLDGAEFESCTSPKQYTDVAVGPHTFTVRACDAVGNCDATPATRTWTVAAEPQWTANNESDEPDEADFCRVEFPTSTDASPGGPVEVYARIFEAGVTEPAGASSVVSAQVGVGPHGADPRSEGGWTWVDAIVNTSYISVDDDDEYVGTFTAPVAPGSYDYVMRFSLDGGFSATYCDADVAGSGSNAGATFEVANMGQLTVAP